MPIPDEYPFVTVDPAYAKDMRIASLKTDINRLESRASSHADWMDRQSGYIKEVFDRVDEIQRHLILAGITSTPQPPSKPFLPDAIRPEDV